LLAGIKKKEMEKFEITVFRQSRVLVGLFLTVFAFMGCVILGAEIKNLLAGLLVFVVFLLSVCYFVVGNLTICIDNEELKFSWKEKLLFNYKDIEPINLLEIKELVIDNGMFLRKIKTTDRTIRINNAKILYKDAGRLISRLRVLTKVNHVKIIDSWDEWKEKGFIRIAYIINSTILILAFLVVTIFIVLKGFNSRQLFVFLLVVPQLYLYGRQMKEKITNDNQ
jgi:hypothetical protein